MAKAKGIRLPDDIVETAMKLADAMPQTMSSTAQDIAKGRPTEIAHLNGYVVREGEALGVATPVNRTLNALIKLLEQSGACRPSSSRPDPAAGPVAPVYHNNHRSHFSGHAATFSPRLKGRGGE